MADAGSAVAADGGVGLLGSDGPWRLGSSQWGRAMAEETVLGIRRREKKEKEKRKKVKKIRKRKRCMLS